VRAVFSEGTEFVLMPGTRSRLLAVDASGARIAIEHGLASFEITPAKSGRWQVDVGPFLVSVKGTAFSVSWDATTERFELKLRHGRVAVSGPLTNGEMAVQAGQRLQIDLPRREAVLKEQKPEEWDELSTDAPSALELPHAQRPSDRTEQTPGPTASTSRDTHQRATVRDKVADDRGWAAALAAGHLDRILAEAERAGITETLEKVSSDDLMALADAARYRRRVDLARAALLAERRRFPGSPRSLEAAFLLGRVEEASDGGLARAARWYDEYLMRAPSGTYASEALGRKMTLTSKLEGNSRARPLAEEYLRRFPKGAYAGAAREFVSTP
jgi:TolA-binding protein